MCPTSSALEYPADMSNPSAVDASPVDGSNIDVLSKLQQQQQQQPVDSATVAVDEQQQQQHQSVEESLSASLSESRHGSSGGASAEVANAAASALYAAYNEPMLAFVNGATAAGSAGGDQQSVADPATAASVGDANGTSAGTATGEAEPSQLQQSSSSSSMDQHNTSLLLNSSFDLAATQLQAHQQQQQQPQQPQQATAATQYQQYQQYQTADMAQYSAAQILQQYQTPVPMSAAQQFQMQVHLSGTNTPQASTPLKTATATASTATAAAAAAAANILDTSAGNLIGGSLQLPTTSVATIAAAALAAAGSGTAGANTAAAGPGSVSSGTSSNVMTPTRGLQQQLAYQQQQAQAQQHSSRFASPIPQPATPGSIMSRSNQSVSAAAIRDTPLRIAPNTVMHAADGSLTTAAMAAMSSIPHQRQLHAEHQRYMSIFWNNQKNDVTDNPQDYKSHTLPLARIKKVMKTDEDVKSKMISAEAPLIFAKACEIMALELTTRAWLNAEECKRRTLQRSDISAAISKCDMFDFLIDIVPREDPNAVTTANGTPIGNGSGSGDRTGSASGTPYRSEKPSQHTTPTAQQALTHQVHQQQQQQQQAPQFQMSSALMAAVGLDNGRGPVRTMSEYGTTGSSAMAGLHHMSHSLPPTSAEHLLGHAQQVSAAHQMQQQVAFAHHHQPSPQQQLHASGRQTPQQYVQHPLAYGSTNPLAFDAAAQLTGVASATNLYGVSAAAAAAAAAAAGSYGLGGFAVNPYGAHTPVGFSHQQQAQQPIQQQQQQQQLHQQQQQQQQQQPQIKHENDELIGVNFASYGLSHTNTSQSMQR